MEAKQVYAEQLALKRLESEVAYLDPEKEAVKIAELTEEIAAQAAIVEAGQEAVGGVVYRVADEHLDRLAKKVEFLGKRAAKHGLGKLAYTVTSETDTTEVTAPWHPEDAAASRISVGVYSFTFVTLAAPRLKLAGWALLAKLSVEEAGVLVSKVPAYARAWATHREGIADGESIEALTETAQGYLDSANLGRFADPATASKCDHCGLSRKRTATYVVESLTTGELKQVGSNCLRDFLGIDPHQLMRYAEMLSELEGSLEDDGEGGYGVGTQISVATLTYLMHVCAMLRTNGWAARSSSNFSTADQADSNRYLYEKQKTGKHGEPLWVEPTQEDQDRAAAAIEWADLHFGEKLNQDGGYGGMSLTDFERNLYIAARSTVVTSRIQGTLAYLPVAHARFLEKEIEFAKGKEAKLAEFVGKIKERIDLTLTVTKVFETEGRYGTTFITTLTDEAGHEFKWFGSYDLPLDKTFVGKWTIKDHSDNEKYGKQTVITRPGDLTRVELVAA